MCEVSRDQVQRTNDSSIVSKNSGGLRQYFEDDFLKHFVSKVNCGRSPLINRGYYVRMKAINSVVDLFLSEFNKAQVVSLGAGFDTLYFRHKEKILHSNSQVVEVDYPTVISRKFKLICQSPELLSLLSSPNILSTEEAVVLCNDYSMIGCDITHLEELGRLLLLCGVDVSIPTLFVSECVLTYVEPQKVDRLLRWIASTFTNCIFCCYEQILPHDGFGQIMKKHFTSLKSPLRNIDLYPTKVAQTMRVRRLGFSTYTICDMNELFQSLPDGEKRRVNLLEPFDEYEDFYQKCNHYTLLCAANGSCCTSLVNHGHSGIVTVYEPTPAKVQLTSLSLSESSSLIKRWGHASVCLKNKMVILIGGFGISQYSLPHRRLNDVLIVHREGDHFMCTTLQNTGHPPAGIVHHRAVLLSDGRILVTGGRGSPSRPQQQFFTIRLEKIDSCHWDAVKFDERSEKSNPRWRHSATLLTYEGLECVMIIGGCSTGMQVLKDIVLVQTSTWRCINLDISLEQGTHSHTALAHGDCVVIVGGVNENFMPLNTCYYIQCREGDWVCTTVTFSNHFGPRFSFAACMCMDNVILIGGVGSMDTTELVIINLMSRECEIREIKLENDDPLLLYCFTAHCVHDGIILLFGGGGNCFSFGTYFNPYPMEFRI